MEIRRLQYFVCIAELGSLGRAADILRIAQPALTRQVQLLEQELGVMLFTRTRRGMHLTEAGSQLLSEVTGPLRDLEGALQNIRSLNAGLSGSITVGMTPTVTYFLAQPLLEQMARVAPDVAVRIVEGTGLHISEGLTSGELDMGLLHEPVCDHRLSNRDLLTEDMVIVGSPASNLAPGRDLSIAELTELPLILPNPKNGLRGITERYAAKYNVHFQIKYVIDSFYVLKEMIANGHGYGIMPLSSILKEVEAGRLTYSPLQHPTRRPLVMSSRTTCRAPRIIAKLQDVMEEVLCQLHQSGRIFGDLRTSQERGNARRPVLMVAKV